MRRGHIISAAVAAFAAVAFIGAPGAIAATPQDICADLQDGHLDGQYTQAELAAFLQDPTVQGYCSPIVIVTTPTTTVTTTTTVPVTTTTSTTPVTTTTSTTPVTTTTSSAVPLVPTVPGVIAGVQGARTTIVTPQGAQGSGPTAAVKGSQHTVKTPTQQSASAPIATTRTKGTLPFTGAQLALFALVGLALVASGLLLRSTSRPSQRQ